MLHAAENWVARPRSGGAAWPPIGGQGQEAAGGLGCPTAKRWGSLAAEGGQGWKAAGGLGCPTAKRWGGLAAGGGQDWKAAGDKALTMMHGGQDVRRVAAEHGRSAAWEAAPAKHSRTLESYSAFVCGNRRRSRRRLRGWGRSLATSVYFTTKFHCA
jgi:hypothetical protein